MAFYTCGVKFENINTVLSIYKRQGKTLEEALRLFSDPGNREHVARVYPGIAPMQMREALLMTNAEQRMAALRSFAVEDIAKELDAVLLNRQTISKKQVRWDRELNPYVYHYCDTYELYSVSLGEAGNNSWNRQLVDIYFVKCNCASTDRVYYLYVPKEVALRKDAIAAIAWTMRFNGKPLTKREYLDYMYSET